MSGLSNRHPSTRQVARWLVANPNLPPRAHFVAKQFESMAAGLIEHTADGPELTAGLRKLLEAKDCLVRATLEQVGAPDE